jgi:hypothetical protein
MLLLHYFSLAVPDLIRERQRKFLTADSGPLPGKFGSGAVRLSFCLPRLAVGASVLAQRRIWASRTKGCAFCDPIIARLARFLTKLHHYPKFPLRESLSISKQLQRCGNFSRDFVCFEDRDRRLRSTAG